MLKTVQNPAEKNLLQKADTEDRKFVRLFASLLC